MYLNETLNSLINKAKFGNRKSLLLFIENHLSCHKLCETIYFVNIWPCWIYIEIIILTFILLLKFCNKNIIPIFASVKFKKMKSFINILVVVVVVLIKIPIGWECYYKILNKEKKPSSLKREGLFLFNIIYYKVWNK